MWFKPENFYLLLQTAYKLLIEQITDVPLIHFNILIRYNDHSATPLSLCQADNSSSISSML